MHFDPLFARYASTTGIYDTEAKNSARLIQRLPAVFSRIPFFEKRWVKEKKDISTVNLQTERRLGRKTGKKEEVKKRVSSNEIIVKNDARKNARKKKVQKVLQKAGPPQFREKTKMSGSWAKKVWKSWFSGPAEADTEDSCWLIKKNLI